MTQDLKHEFDLLAGRLRSWLEKGVQCVTPDGVPAVDEEGKPVYRELLPRDISSIVEAIECVQAYQMPKQGTGSYKVALLAAEFGQKLLDGGPPLTRQLVSPEQYNEYAPDHGSAA